MTAADRMTRATGLCLEQSSVGTTYRVGLVDAGSHRKAAAGDDEEDFQAVVGKILVDGPGVGHDFDQRTLVAGGLEMEVFD